MTTLNYAVRLDHLEQFEKNPIAKWVEAVNWPSFNMDANEGVIFARQLEYVESRAYEVKYPTLKGRELFPIDYSVPTGAATYTYRMYDHQGAFNLITNYSDDFKRVNVTGVEVTGKVHSYGAAVEYSVQDIRGAAMAGVPLQDHEVRAARRASEQKLDEIILNGEANGNLYGIMTHPNVPSASVPAGVSTTTPWTTKTPDEILFDLNDIVSDMVVLTKGVEAPTDLVLPIAQYELINNTARSSTSDTTILEFFLRNNQHIQRVHSWYKLAGAGAGTTDVMLAYRNDPEVMETVIPQEFEMFPAQPKNMAFNIPCHARFGGVRIRYPLAVSLRIGI
jgi:hypothetical protein